MIERRRELGCFGGRVAVTAAGAEAAREEIDSAMSLAAARLLWIHSRLTRFSPSSELSLLNADPRAEVPASRPSAEPGGGRELGGRAERGPGGRHLPGRPRGGRVQRLDRAARGTPPARRPEYPATPGRARTRPPSGATSPWTARRAPSAGLPGLRIDSGGIAKGLAAELIGASLAGLDSYCVDCAGDLRIGGASAIERLVLVRDPWDGESVAELHVTDGAVATSGITARAWRDASGRPRHHLIDPGRGTSAWTGVAQATALAPSALEAEVLAKAALLAGPASGPARLVHGGVLVLDDGELIEVAAPRAEAAAA